MKNKVNSKINNFVRIMEKAKNDKDLGLKFLRTEISVSSKLKAMRYGNLFVVVNPILINDIDIDLNNPISNEIIVDSKFKSNNSYKYVEVHRVSNPKEIRRISDYKFQFGKGVLKDEFNIVVEYNVETIMLDAKSNYEILIQTGINVFVATKYGCFDVANVSKFVSPKESIKEIFKGSDIVLYPSIKNYTFAKDLEDNIKSILVNQDNTINFEDLEKIDFNIKYKPLKSYVIGSPYNLINIASVFIDGKYFCLISNNYATDVEVTVSSNCKGDVTFKSTINTYSLKVRISSSMLADFISQNDMKTLTITSTNSDIDFSKVIGIKISSDIYKKYGSIKSKYYSLLVDPYDEMYKVRIAIVNKLCNEVNFKKIEDKDASDYGKIFVHERVKNITYNSDRYIIKLYKTCNHSKRYTTSNIVENIYIVQNKKTEKIYIITAYLSLTQVQLKSEDDDISMLPILFYMPYKCITGDDFKQSNIPNTINYKYSDKLKREVYDIIVNEFKDEVLFISPSPEINIVCDEFMKSSFEDDISLTFNLNPQKDEEIKDNNFVKSYSSELDTKNDKHIDITFYTNEYDCTAISKYVKNPTDDFFVLDYLIQVDIVHFLNKNSE